MALVTILNVLTRNVTGDSIAWTEELNQFLIVLVCFVGLSYAAGEGRHIRMSALSDALPDRFRRWLMIFVTSTTALLLFFLAYYAWSYAVSVDRRSPVMGVPLRWVYMIAPIGLVLGGIQYGMAAIKNVSGTQIYISFDRLDDFEELELDADVTAKGKR